MVSVPCRTSLKPWSNRSYGQDQRSSRLPIFKFEQELSVPVRAWDDKVCSGIPAAATEDTEIPSGKDRTRRWLTRLRGAVGVFLRSPYKAECPAAVLSSAP
ncbi:unnamed protein product [Nezara viridula]|uniref:Uncharacterized protein n=1 Tax=Nezara viridula TaxID=85310 RepID=A0A9P0E982_NEZVI|nr:unnamed protein product [Nezara viridula]